MCTPLYREARRSGRHPLLHQNNLRVEVVLIKKSGEDYLRFVALRLVVFFAAFFTVFLAAFLTVFFAAFFTAFLGAAFFATFFTVFFAAFFFAAIGIAMTMTNSVDPSARIFCKKLSR